ncbi:MAG: AbrB/MazE/SpoVT family DNA-binding domain-containing protein [Chloroflexi bacterium]|nr:AbrB/MazE/SpoVT family DNA-binding domain-containing protein [Chloroflexota bacterium]
MKTRIIKIGNSRGIRIPKLFLDHFDWGEEVELELQPHQIVIRPSQGPRQGWDQQFQVMAAKGEDRLLDDVAPHQTTWDAKEWEW